jgi:hypothetical protein
MRKSAGAILVATFLIASLAANVAEAQMNRFKPTARAQMEKVAEAAKAWAPDAALISINSNQVNEDGTAGAWTYTYMSRRKGKWNLFTAKGREITNLEVPQGSDRVIKDLFADSDVVMGTAVLSGIKGKTPRMNLSAVGWIVRGGDDPGDTIITISPTSGDIVKKTTVGR